MARCFNRIRRRGCRHWGHIRPKCHSASKINAAASCFDSINRQQIGPLLENSRDSRHLVQGAHPISISGLPNLPPHVTLVALLGPLLENSHDSRLASISGPPNLPPDVTLVALLDPLTEELP